MLALARRAQFLRDIRDKAAGNVLISYALVIALVALASIEVIALIATGLLAQWNTAVPMLSAPDIGPGCVPPAGSGSRSTRLIC